MSKLILVRNPSQYAQCSPKAIAEGSIAQMLHFVEDAKKDIVSLSHEVGRLTEERDRIERNRDMYRGQVERQSATIEAMREALDACEDYFDNKADADCDQDGFIPNEEMKLLTLVRAASKAGA